MTALALYITPKISLIIVHYFQLSQNGPYTTGREPDHKVHRKSQTNCPLFTTFPKKALYD